MGGVILVGLVAVLVVILVRPALKARARARRERMNEARGVQVVEQLEDHRRR